VTSSGAFAQMPAPAPPTPRNAIDAWRGITLRQVGVTFLLGCVLFVVGILTGIALGAGTRGLPFAFVGAQIRAFTLLLAFVVADRATGGDPDRRVAYAAAVVVGAAVATLLAVAFVSTMFNRFVLEQPAHPTIAFRLYMALDLVLIGGAVFWMILDRRRAARARARMQRAELERIDAEKRSLESDLQALQARVEPQFLFNTLAQVHDLYRADATRGERMLDELIAYLHAAMPRMRDTASTLAQELELVRAYLAMVKVRLGDRLDYAIDAPPAAGAIRMPPMMMLPLVDHAIAHGIERSRSQGRLRVDIDASGPQVRLSIVDGGAGLLPEGGDEQIAEIRSRLAALYGDRATLTLRPREPGASEAVLDLPLERVESA